MGLLDCRAVPFAGELKQELLARATQRLFHSPVAEGMSLQSGADE